MEKRRFVVPQVPNNDKEDKMVENDKNKTTYKREPFVSSIFGTKVKDEITFNGAQFGNKGRQYDAFRDKEDRIVKDDYLDYVTYRERDQEEQINIEYAEKFEITRDLSNEPKIIERTIPINKEEKIVEEFENLASNKSEFTEELFVEEVITPKPRNNYEVERQDRRVSVENEVNRSTPQNNSRKVETTKVRERGKYIAPPLSLLRKGKPILKNDMAAVQYQRQQIDTTLNDFSIPGRVVHFTKGPAVTQFEVQLEPGVKVQKVKSIASNFMANLKAKSIRIQAPIPGKSTIGIEVPNNTTDLVLFGELLSNEDFLNDGNPMNVVLGLDLSGKPVYLNLAKMPHCLIGGTTGSGKSVCINSMIASILYKAHPDDVKLILIDPKIIEFSNYEDMPHLATPIITEPKVATAALRWAVEEMENRYQLFRTLRVREYDEYAKVAQTSMNVKHIPYIVIVIDELADLMLVAGNDVEDYIQRLTQKGRASGIHLIIATQRPSVDVIKGTIKTNIPTRIAFLVKSQVDSNIILDHVGAESLLGHGDMLYNDSVDEQRLQGAYISADEINAITNYIVSNSDADFLFTQEELEEKLTTSDQVDGMYDDMFPTIARFVVENKSASINRIQKTFGIGFNRAQAIIQGLEELGIVSENLGSRARTVEVDSQTLEGILEDI